VFDHSFQKLYLVGSLGSNYEREMCVLFCEIGWVRGRSTVGWSHIRFGVCSLCCYGVIFLGCSLYVSRLIVTSLSMYLSLTPLPHFRRLSNQKFFPDCVSHRQIPLPAEGFPPSEIICPGIKPVSAFQWGLSNRIMQGTHHWTSRTGVRQISSFPHHRVISKEAGKRRRTATFRQQRPDLQILCVVPQHWRNHWMYFHRVYVLTRNNGIMAAAFWEFW